MQTYNFLFKYILIQNKTGFAFKVQITNLSGLIVHHNCSPPIPFLDGGHYGHVYDLKK